MAGKRAEERDLRKRTLRKEICDYIQDQIAQGRFHPGDRVVETQLAKELNVSQAPVREAILEGLGACSDCNPPSPSDAEALIDAEDAAASGETPAE